MHWDVHYVASTGSTNSDLLAMARSGAPAGTVLRADHQTDGRGRLGRTWQAAAGTSLLASVLLEAEPLPFVVVARVALAASDACHDLAGLDVALKWPNDLLLGDRKLAGLLAEAETGTSGIVVGIGCNLRWPGGPEDLPDDLRETVAALSFHCDHVPQPGELLDATLRCLDGWLGQPQDHVLAAYRNRCATIGRVVRVSLPGRSLEGVASGITGTGALEVRTAVGTEVVHAGDVVHVRPSWAGRAEPS